MTQSDRKVEIEAQKQRIVELAQKQNHDEQVLGSELYELQVALATPGCKGKFNAFIKTLPIARSSVYRQIAKHKATVGLTSNRPNQDNSKRPRATKRMFNFRPEVKSRLHLWLSALTASVSGQSPETVIERLVEAEYERAMGIGKAVVTVMPPATVSTVALGAASMDPLEQQAA